MNTINLSHHARCAILAIGIVFFAYLMSLVLRADALEQRTGAQGLEATYHVLWTIEALENSPASAHHFLPTVTLAPEPGNPIRWGATVPTPSGSYVYTSFPPLGFLLPLKIFAWAGVGPSFFTLGLLNSLVGLIAAIGTGALARSVVLSVTDEGESRQQEGWMAFALVSVCYLYLRESLVSHGSVYWPHSFSQLCLISGSWLAFRIFSGRQTLPDILALLLVCMLYPSLEWTGFVFNIGLMVALVTNAYVQRRENPGARRGLLVDYAVPVLVALTTVVSGIVLLLPYISVIGASEMMSALSKRASMRAGRGYAIFGLPYGYFVSFGALLPLSAYALWHAVSNRLFFSKRSLWLLLFVASFPALENLALLQHAYQFSFDRLKLAVPLLLIGAVVAAGTGLLRRPAIMLGIAGIIVASNIQIFGYDSLYYRSWGDAVKKNEEILRRFKADPLAECSVLGTSSSVRGYLNLAFSRDIFEGADVNRLISYANEKGRCGVVYIGTDSVLIGLPKVTSIEVFDINGHPLHRYQPAL